MKLKPWVILVVILIIGIIVTSTILTGCQKNHFEADNRIYPKVLDVNMNVISIEYYLGKLLVLDTFEVTNTAQAIYMREHIDDLDLRLKISYSDSDPL